MMRVPKVLLIDDEEAFVRNLSAIFDRRGYQTLTAKNGDEGLRLLRENDLDVVILDLRMPGMSGMDVLRQIKPGLNSSPEVIILTGFGTIETGIDGLNHGAFDYVTKPIKIDDLVRRISAAYERKIIKQKMIMDLK